MDAPEFSESASQGAKMDAKVAEERLIELVGYLVQGVVTQPDDVEVEEFYDATGTVFGVRVHPDDIGRVIGKDGRVASAIRHVVKAAAIKANAHVTVEILTDGPDPAAEARKASEKVEAEEAERQREIEREHAATAQKIEQIANESRAD